MFKNHLELVSVYLDACQEDARETRQAILERMRGLGAKVARSRDQQLRKAYELTARLISLALNDHKVSEEVALPVMLDRIRENGEPGISVVTCSMNRSENLVKAIPSWLFHSEIREVVIVDWSSGKPVQDVLVAHGISDPRCSDPR